MENVGEWTGRVEISEEEIPCSKRSMYGYILTYPGPDFKGRTLKLCALNDGTLICASAAPHFGGKKEQSKNNKEKKDGHFRRDKFPG